MADFTFRGERYREFGFATKDRAQGWEADARAAVMNGRPLPSRASQRPSVASAGPSIGTLLDHCARVHWASKKAAITLTRTAALFVEYCGRDTPVSEALTSGTVSEYVVELQEMERSGSTINRHLAAISVLCNYAVDQDLILKRPKLPKQREGQGRIRWFTEQEEDAILAVLRQWGMDLAADYFIFLADTGARPNEARRLRWDDIQKGDKLLTFWDTKNGDARTIVLTSRVKAVIAKRRAEAPLSTGPFSEVNRWALRAMWERLRTHLPFIGDAVMYTYRHTCCSRLIQKGVELVRVKEWMGHKTIQTTLRYAHLAPKHMDEVAAALER